LPAIADVLGALRHPALIAPEQHGDLMPGGPLDETLTIAERRAIARDRHPEAKPAEPKRGRRFRYCLRPLTNGVSYCSEECAERLCDITPTIDGEVS
jgi:hypothetical protein